MVRLHMLIRIFFARIQQNQIFSQRGKSGLTSDLHIDKQVHTDKRIHIDTVVVLNIHSAYPTV